MRFALTDLTVPILGAPMAGGPSTPALAAAVSNAGGLGFLAGGYLSAEKLADQITAARAGTGGALGVNLFVPQPSTADPELVALYREQLTPLASQLGTTPGDPRWDDDGWADKLDVVADLRPEVVSFTFALPPAEVLDRLRQLAVYTLMTVTSAEEAGAAAARGFDALVVQGPSAGGHRGTWDAGAAPPPDSLTEVLAAGQRFGLPLVAAGGIADAADVAAARGAGARAVQVGTALLLADEAGTNPVHRAALTSGEFVETVVTRSFSGRYARGLRNDFTERFDAAAPPGYPELHYLTAPIRRAAVAAGNPQATNLWAGTSFAKAGGGPVAQIVSGLAAVG